MEVFEAPETRTHRRFGLIAELLRAGEEFVAAVGVDVVVRSQRIGFAEELPDASLRLVDLIPVDAPAVGGHPLVLEPQVGITVAREEELRADGGPEEGVVVGQQEAVGQPRNTGQRPLDRRGVENRQGIGRQDFAVVDDPHARMRRIEPCGRLSVGHDVDPPDPRREPLGRAQRIAQLVVLDEPAVARDIGPLLFGHLLSGIAGLLRPPDGVSTVHPHIYEIDFHHFPLFLIRSHSG